LKIISAFDEKLESLGKYSSDAIASYANHHKFDYSIYKINLFERPAAWAKIQCLINEIGLKTHDYILWVDADALFVRFNENIIQNIHNDKDIFMVNHLVTLAPLNGNPGIFIQCERPNTGVLLVKTSDWSLGFLEKVWGETQFINHPWWDQAAFHKLMGYSYEISDKKTINSPVVDIMKHIGWLDSIWNAVPTSINNTLTGRPVTQYPYNPIIVHFAGCLSDVRLKEMAALRRYL
jgi:hypothetical protein